MSYSETPLDQHLAHFQWRVLQDALAEATAAYWLRRAAAFTAVGNARCDEIAQACRNHATLVADLGLDKDTQDLIHDVLTELGPTTARVEIIGAPR